MGCCSSTATVPPSLPPPLPAQPVDQPELVQSTQRTHAPSTNTSHAPPVATPSKDRERAPNAAQPRTSTLSPKHHAVMPERVRSHDFESLPYRRSSRDHPHFSRSASMDPRNPPVGTQPVAKRHGSQPRFLSTLPSLLPNDFRYAARRCPISYYLQFHPQIQNSRCGKGASYLIKHALDPTEACLQRESGKSSLINAVFKVNMNVSVCTQSSLHSCLTNLSALKNYKGAPINVSGRTTEFLPRDNRQLIVHECSGSGPRDLQAIRDFVTTRNHKNRPASERLHAIW